MVTSNHLRNDIDIYITCPQKRMILSKNLQSLDWKQLLPRNKASNKDYENGRDLRCNEHYLNSIDLWVQCSNTELTCQPGAGHYVGSKKPHEVMNKWL